MFKSPENFGNYRGNQFAYRESVKFKNAIQGLEQLDELTTQDRVLILATALDLKPASVVVIKKENFRLHDRLLDTLSDLGLFFSESESPHNADAICITIGGTPVTIGTAMENVFTTDEAFGASMGFPNTAVHAYSQADLDGGSPNEKLLSWKETREQLTPEEQRFLFFRLSKDNYKDEVELVEQIIAATKEYTPRLYEKVMTQKVERPVD